MLREFIQGQIAISNLKFFTAALCGVTLASGTDAQTLSNWTLSGPGTTGVSGTVESPTFSYNLSGRDGSWSARATALESGTLYYDYDYDGFHAFFRVTAFLRAVNPNETLVNAGPQDCCTEPSNGFSYSGTEVFQVQAGDVIGFDFGGSNTDSNDILRGILAIIGTFVIEGDPLAEMVAASSTVSRFLVLGAQGVARDQGEASFAARDTAPPVSRNAVAGTFQTEPGAARTVYTWADFNGFRAADGRTDRGFTSNGIQVGADIDIGSNMIAGLSLGAQTIDTSTALATQEGSVFFVQPYLALRSDAWSGEMTLLHGQGTYDQTGFMGEGQGETTITALTARVGYDVPFESGVLTPTVNIALGQEEATGTSGTLESLGTESVDFGQLSLGARYREQLESGTKFAGLYADYLETSSDNRLVANRLVDDGWTGRVEIGVSADVGSDVGLDMSVEIGGMGGELHQISGGVRATFTF